ncbi:transposase, partial [Pedobacter gandavensis]|uniref:transposase n=1 Tax=Pedobacter gandavensis TaxID=2679963 RepID=UPI00292F8611
ENEAIELSKKTGNLFQSEVLCNGDTIKQLLARSRYAFCKRPSAWTDSQKNRAELLFKKFPDLKTAYGLSQLFENTKDKIFGLANLAKWHEKVRQTAIKSFNTMAKSIQTIIELY